MCTNSTSVFFILSFWLLSHLISSWLPKISRLKGKIRVADAMQARDNLFARTLHNTPVIFNLYFARYHMLYFSPLYAPSLHPYPSFAWPTHTAFSPISYLLTTDRNRDPRFTKLCMLVKRKTALR